MPFHNCPSAGEPRRAATPQPIVWPFGHGIGLAKCAAVLTGHRLQEPFLDLRFDGWPAFSKFSAARNNKAKTVSYTESRPRNFFGKIVNNALRGPNLEWGHEQIMRHMPALKAAGDRPPPRRRGTGSAGGA
jgi:hypothetical protein